MRYPGTSDHVPEVMMVEVVIVTAEPEIVMAEAEIVSLPPPPSAIHYPHYDDEESVIKTDCVVPISYHVLDRPKFSHT